MKTPSTRSLAAFASIALLATLIAHAARMDPGGIATERTSPDLLPQARSQHPATPVATPRIAAGAVGIAKILFFVFVIMAIVAFVASFGRKG